MLSEQQDGLHQDFPRTAIVTWPIHTSGTPPLSGLLQIISALRKPVHLITGGLGDGVKNEFSEKAVLHYVNYKTPPNSLIRILSNVFLQTRISCQLFKIAGSVDCFIFFQGGAVMILPMLTAKLRRKKVILNFSGSDANDANAQLGGVVSRLVRIITNINCSLSDKMLVYSESLISEWRLERYVRKISIAHRHFIDYSEFNVQKPFSERPATVGYFGRLSEEKGIMALVEAIPGILKHNSEIHFVIGGDGSLSEKINGFIVHNNIANSVRVTGWIRHTELAAYLNEMKLVVIPSYSEGLPNILLEAMACGTPVMATPVGAITDIIKDGITGFIMPDNHPDTVRKNVIRALDCANLETITRNACDFAIREFTFETAKENYGRYLKQVARK